MLPGASSDAHRAARRATPARGFTLIEILVVVVILGILAAIVVPQITMAASDAEQAAFAANIRKIAQAEARHRLDTGLYLADGGSGTVPAGFEAYIPAEQWENGTPVGGVWDAELNESGITSAFGVHFNGTGPTRDAAYMTVVDEMIDDGDLTSGGFRQLAGDRFYWVVAD